MKVQIEKKALLEILIKTQNIIERRLTMPVLANVLLEATKYNEEQGCLKIFATDLEISLTDNAQAIVDEQGYLAVQAKNFYEIIKELSDGPIFLTKKSNNWLEIKQGSYESKIVGISAGEYPTFPTFVGQNFQKMSGAILRDMIDKTIYCLTAEDSRYFLNGVFFQQMGTTGYTMVGTDGHRLSLVKKNLDISPDLNSSGNAMDVGVIIPRKGLYEIRKLIDSVNDDIELCIEGTQLILRHQETILMIRLIEGKFPNYQLFLPNNLDKKIVLQREAFLSSVKRVSLLANQKSKSLTFHIKDSRMEISSNNPEMGDAKEEFNVKCEEDLNVRVGFNGKYVQDILSAMDEEYVDLEISGKGSPGMIKPHKDNSYTCVIMPMKI